MADEKYAGTQIVSSDFLRVLLTLKKNIMRDLKVATLGIVKGVDDVNQQVTVQTFPLIENEMTKNISCVNGCPDTLQEKDIVLVLFLDRNFIQNLKQAKKNQARTELKENNDLHSEKYGIVISKIFGEAPAGSKYPVKWTAKYENDILTQTLEMSDGSTLSNRVIITGDNDYDKLSNKPQIEGVTLGGNQTFSQLGLNALSESEIDDICV